MNNIKIRQAQLSDLEIIKKFQLLLAAESEGVSLQEEILKKGLIAVFKDATKGQYYVAEADHKIIASLMITKEWSDWRNGMIWWIQSVYVDKAYRKSGIFRKMYTYIKELVLQDPGIRGLRLYVDLTNTAALAVYTLVGMNGDHYKVFEWMKD